MAAPSVPSAPAAFLLFPAAWIWLGLSPCIRNGPASGTLVKMLSPHERRNRRIVTAGVMSGMFVSALEATVIATAMPTVIAALGGMNHYSWVFSAYLLTATVTVPIWGKLSDLYGRRTLYQVSMAVFLLGTILSGLSATMTQLIVFRALQGIGAGGLVPLGMTIIGEIFTLEERAKMQGFFSGVWGLASIVGPLIGGFITDHLSWRWVFYVNVPIGLAAAMMIRFALPQRKAEGRPVIDYAGAFTLTASMTALMLAAMAEGSSLFSVRNVILGVVAVTLLVLFVLIEKKAKEPIVPLDLFRNRVIAVAVSTGFLAGIAMFTAITFVPLFAQGVRGSTATQAGSLLTPLMLSWVSMSIIGGRLLSRVGQRPMVLTGYILLSIGMTLLSTFDSATTTVTMVLVLALVGSGLGLTMLTLLLAVQQSVPREQLGIATSLNQFSRSIGGAIGVAIMGAILSAGLVSHLTADAQAGRITGAEAARLSADPSAMVDGSVSISRRSLESLREALTASLHGMFRIAALVAACGFLIAMIWLPASVKKVHNDAPQGELMAELTTIDERNEPLYEK